MRSTLRYEIYTPYRVFDVSCVLCLNAERPQRGECRCGGEVHQGVRAAGKARQHAHPAKQCWRHLAHGCSGANTPGNIFHLYVAHDHHVCSIAGYEHLQDSGWTPACKSIKCTKELGRIDVLQCSIGAGISRKHRKFSASERVTGGTDERRRTAGRAGASEIATRLARTGCL